MLKPEIKYTEKELIAKINDEFGANALNRSMLAYMRDMRCLIPKPIRKHIGRGRGGSYSYYTEDTYKLIRLILKEKIHNGKNLKEIQVEFRSDIEEAFSRREDYVIAMNNSIREMVKTMESVRKHMISAAEPIMKAQKQIVEPMIMMQKQLASAFESFKNIDGDKFIRDSFIAQLKETINALEKGDEEQIDHSIEELQSVTVRVKQLRVKMKKWKAIKQSKEGSDKK